MPIYINQQDYSGDCVNWCQLRCSCESCQYALVLLRYGMDLYIISANDSGVHGYGNRHLSVTFTRNVHWSEIQSYVTLKVRRPTIVPVPIAATALRCHSAGTGRIRSTLYQHAVAIRKLSASCQGPSAQWRVLRRRCRFLHDDNR